MYPGGVLGTHGQDGVVGDTVGIGVGNPSGHFISMLVPPLGLGTCPVLGPVNILHMPRVAPEDAGTQFMNEHPFATGIVSASEAHDDADDEALVCVNRRAPPLVPKLRVQDPVLAL